MPSTLRFQAIAKPAVGSPTRKAALFTVAYLLGCGTYIVLSSELAAMVARDTGEMAGLEIAKGLTFVLLTGAAFFAFAHWQWSKLRRLEETIIRQEHALLLNERKNVAAVFASALAHDLNNVLLVMKALSHSVKTSTTPEELAEIADDTAHAIDGVQRLTQQLKGAAQDALPTDAHALRLDERLTQLVRLVRRHPDVTRKAVTLRSPQHFTLRSSGTLFDEAVLNLVINAAHAGERIEVALAPADTGAVLEVHDDGPGVPERLVGEIFNPCFTTKKDGTGLGLLAVRALASSVGGDVEVTKSPLGGALFRVHLPGAEPN